MKRLEFKLEIWKFRHSCIQLELCFKLMPWNIRLPSIRLKLRLKLTFLIRLPSIQLQLRLNIWFQLAAHDGFKECSRMMKASNKTFVPTKQLNVRRIQNKQRLLFLMTFLKVRKLYHLAVPLRTLEKNYWQRREDQGSLFLNTDHHTLISIISHLTFPLAFISRLDRFR